MTDIDAPRDRKTGESWRRKAADRAGSGMLESMVSNELFDHTWVATAWHLHRALDLRPNQRLLDAGCGWGRVIHALEYHEPTLRIDGLELTAEFVERARRLLHEASLDDHVTITQADLTTAEIPAGVYDAFYSTRVLHYVDDKRGVLERLHRGLRPGGRGIVILPNRYCPYRWLTYHHAPLYPIGAVGKLMRDVGFTDLRYGGFGFLPPRPRLSHRSILCRVDYALSRTPLGHLGALAWVMGRK
jgi:SAM-dependent methyltransferase